MPRQDKDKKLYNKKRKIHRVRRNLKKELLNSDNAQERKYTDKTEIKKRLRNNNSGSKE